MARYIDGDLFTKELRKLIEKKTDCNIAIMPDVFEVIGNQPTADVKEVVRGEWITDYEYEKCNNCNFSFREIMDSDSNFDTNFKITEMNFCPHCGADMREGVE